MAVSNDKWHRYLAKNANCIANVGYSNLLATSTTCGTPIVSPYSGLWSMLPRQPTPPTAAIDKFNRARFYLDKCDFGFSWLGNTGNYLWPRPCLLIFMRGGCGNGNIVEQMTSQIYIDKTSGNRWCTSWLHLKLEVQVQLSPLSNVCIHDAPGGCNSSDRPIGVPLLSE